MSGKQTIYYTLPMFGECHWDRNINILAPYMHRGSQYHGTETSWYPKSETFAREAHFYHWLVSQTFGGNPQIAHFGTMVPR